MLEKHNTVFIVLTMIFSLIVLVLIVAIYGKLMRLPNRVDYKTPETIGVGVTSPDVLMNASPSASPKRVLR